MTKRPVSAGLALSAATALFALAAGIPALAQDPENYHPVALKLVEQKEYRKALDELIKAVVAEPENPKVYATLSLLYLRIKECSLTWKYYEVAKDLRHEDADLLRSLPALCKEPKEKKIKDLPEFFKEGSPDANQIGPAAGKAVLWLPFPPEQSQWQSQAKMPLIPRGAKGMYWELNLAQMRKVRELTGVTVPWVMISPGGRFKVQVIMSKDNWTMLATEFPATLTQP